jgi:hypothetical protein
MPKKQNIFQVVQHGLESVAGTPVAANKKLLAASFKIKPELESIPFRAAGNKYHSFVSPNKQWSTFSIEEGPLTYNEILYLLSSLISKPTPAQQGVTTAYKWIFASNTSSEDAGQTFTIEQGDSITAWRVAGARVSGLNFTFNRNGCMVSGAGVGEAIEKGITLTASPTSLTPKPVLPMHLKFYMADSQAGLAGATAMTDGFAMTFGLTDKVGLAWPVGQDPYPVETEPNLSGSIRLASDSVGMGMLDLLTAGSTKWFRIKGTGALIASTYYQDFQIDFPAQISEISGFDNEGGAHVISYGLIGIHDATWGKAFEITVITDVEDL